MTSEKMIARVLAAYPSVDPPTRIHSHGKHGGLSGSQFWEVETPETRLLLRRWPKHCFPLQHLQFVQAVLWQAKIENVPGIHLPLETVRRKGVVCEDGSLWELWPMMPGKPLQEGDIPAEQASAALTALAEFHRATVAFPLPTFPQGRSPGVRNMLQEWKHLLNLRLYEISEQIAGHVSPPLAQKSRKLLSLVYRLSGNGMTLLSRAARLSVRLQPCLGDIRAEHLFFQGERVTGWIDFEAMRTDNIAADIARLIGSLAGNDRRLRQEYLEVYQRHRPLTDAELYLIATFDRFEMLLEATDWMYRFYGRREPLAPDQLATLLHRFDSLLGRLEFQEELTRSIAA